MAVGVGCGVAALAAGSRDQKVFEAQTFARQTRNAVVCIGAGTDAVVAARAFLQIDHEEAVRFHQALLEERIE